MIFSAWSCSRLRCAGLCKVTLPCLWILGGILSAPQGTIHGLLACSKPLPLFVLFLFFISSVGRLWVCSRLGQFLCLGPFGSRWSFFRPSIQVCVLSVGIGSLSLLSFTWDFFTSVLADGLSLGFKWQYVSSSLKDYTQYSGRPQYQ